MADLQAACGMQDTSEHQAAVSRLVHDGAAEQPPAMCTAASNAAWEEGTSDSEDSSEFAAHASALRPPARSAGPGSIASTYWRPERADRNEHLSAIDERYSFLITVSAACASMQGTSKQQDQVCTCQDRAFGRCLRSRSSVWCMCKPRNGA